MDLAVVSSWLVPCGVAQYTEALCEELIDSINLKVYAEEVHTSEINPLSKKQIPYIRCWKRGEGFESLFNEIIKDKPDIVHCQFESSLYNTQMFTSETLFQDFIKKLHLLEIPTVLTLHNVPVYNPSVSGNWYADLESYFIVTNKLMEQELLKWHPHGKITIIPLGSTFFEPLPKDEARGFLYPEDENFDLSGYYITQVGFYGYDKGMLPLIKAMPEILKEIPDAKLVFAGSIHPLAPQIHKEYVKECIRTALKLNLMGKVVFVNKFLSEEEINLWLSAADIIAINHQFVFGLFSSSASAHRCLCAERPIIMNSQDVRLSEFTDGVNCVKSSNEDLAKKIINLANDPDLQRKVYKGAKDYSFETSFKKIAEKHLEVYENV